MRRAALLLLSLSLTVAGCARHQVVLAEQAPATFADEPGGYETARVIDTVDGDTIEVEIVSVSPGPGAGDARPGGKYTVRFIGIDTPESVKRGSPVECFGRESSAATRALLSNAEVRLVKDVEETDRFDRLLRYVYVGEEMANARLVANGYAFAYTYPPNIRHSEILVQLEREAREANRGLWSPDTCNKY